MTTRSIESILIGNLLDYTATFVDVDGDPTDPTAVTFLYMAPGEDIVTLTWANALAQPTTGAIWKDETGVFVARIDTSPFDPGVFHGTFHGTGAATAAGTASVLLVDDPVAVPATP